MTRNPKVMLLIDADNVSVDVIEQAIEMLVERHGALPVRRAHCTPESAVKHQKFFKRLAIRPVVNLAAGKNSTDIALAVDAIDLVHAERPDVMVIASSDSDFAPLVTRLREKGCHVVGIGQQGKTGDETQAVYDEYTVISHRKGSPAAKSAAKSAARAPARTAARSADRAQPQRTTDAAQDSKAAKAGSDTAARAAQAVLEVIADSVAEAASADPPAAAAAAAKKSTRSRRKPAAAKSTTAAAAPDAAARAASAGKSSASDPAAVVPAALLTRPSPAKAVAAAPDDKSQQILDALPALSRGGTIELNVAAQKLKEAGLLSRSGASTKLFGRYPGLFELIPEKQPNAVRLRTSADA